MIYDEEDYKYYNKEPTIVVSRYPGVGLHSGFRRNSRGVCNNAYLAYEPQRITIDGVTKNISVPCIKFSITTEYDYLKYDSKYRSEWIDDYFYYKTKPTTPESAIKQRVDAALKFLPNAYEALAEAESGENSMIGIVHSNNTKWVSVPLGSILGTDKVQYKIKKKDYADCSGFELDGSIVRLNNLFNNVDMRIEVRSLDEGGTINVDGYDTTGGRWYNNLLVRNAVIPLDLSDIPDHQVRPN